MARHIYQGTFKDQNGAVVGSSTTSDGNPGTVTVYLAGTSTLASIYTASAGGVAVNSVTTDAYGYFYFWIDDGTYAFGQKFKIVLTHPDFITREYDNIEIIIATDAYITTLITTGTNFLQSGTGAVAITYQNKMRQGVHVKDFGAVGAGADETTILQAALDAHLCVDFSGVGLTYAITDTLDLRTGHKLTFGGATIQQYTDQKPIFDATNKDDISITGGVFVGKGDYLDNPTSVAVGILCTGSEDVNVNNCHFSNFGYAALKCLSGGVNISFTNNTVVGPGVGTLSDPSYNDCAGIVAIGTGIVISNNIISQTAQGLIVGEASSNVTVSGNVIFDIVNEHGMYIDTAVRNCSITGNAVRNVGGVGIKVQWYDDAVLTDEPTAITVSGNSIFTAGSDGIQVINSVPDASPFYARSVIVSNNAVRVAGQDGINVRYWSGGTVSGNSVYEADRYGIALTNCEDVNVSGNNIKQTQQCGIVCAADATNVDGCLNVLIDSNAIFYPAQVADGDGLKCTGILINTGSYINITNNLVRGEPTKMLYGLWIYAGSQTTMVIKNNYLAGAIQVGARFISPVEGLLEYRDNYLNGYYGDDTAINAPTVTQRGNSGMDFYNDVVPAGTGKSTWTKGARVWNSVPSASNPLGWVCVTSGTFSTASEAGTYTTGSPTITALADTSDFLPGQYASVNTGWPSTGPYLILSLTASTITLETNANGAGGAVTVTTPDPVFKAMANLAA